MFTRYGEGYALHDIWLQGESEGAVAALAEPERHLAKSGAARTEQRIPAVKPHRG